MNKALFLDRDGILNELVHHDVEFRGPRYLHELRIQKDAEELVSIATNSGYMCFVVTNQPDISRGNLAADEHDLINSSIARSVPGITEFFTCPHDNLDLCKCRKPLPGLLLTAVDKFNINVANSLMIGDRWTDVLAAKNAGVRSVLVEDELSWSSSSQGGPPAGLRPDFVFSELRSALELFEM